MDSGQEPNLDSNLEGVEGEGTTVRKSAPDKPAAGGVETPPAGKGKETVAEPAEGSTLLGGGEAGKEPPKEKPWMSALPKDLKENPETLRSLSGFDSQNDVIRAYLAGQGKSININELIEAASAEDKEKYWKLRGRPEKPEGYKLDEKANLPKEIPVDKTTLEGFRQVAHKMGLNQAEAQELVSFYNQSIASAVNQQRNRYIADMRATDQQLRSEWHGDYESNMTKAKRAASMFGGQDLAKLLNDTRLGDNPIMIRAWYRVGQAMAEDTLRTSEQEPAPQRTPGKFQYPSMEE